MWPILNFNTAISFLKKYPLLAFISCYTRLLSENIFSWAYSKWDNIWIIEHYEVQYELLKYGLWVWLGEVTLYLLPTPHLSLPRRSLFLMEIYWKQVLLRSNVASTRVVCALSSVIDPIGTWIYFFRNGDRFAFLAILSGSLCNVCERN
jgi:hypothetical protein